MAEDVCAGFKSAPLTLLLLFSLLVAFAASSPVCARVQVLGAGQIQEAGAGKLGDDRSPEELSALAVVQ